MKTTLHEWRQPIMSSSLHPSRWWRSSVQQTEWASSVTKLDKLTTRQPRAPTTQWADDNISTDDTTNRQHHAWCSAPTITMLQSEALSFEACVKKHDQNIEPSVAVLPSLASNRRNTHWRCQRKNACVEASRHSCDCKFVQTAYQPFSPHHRCDFHHVTNRVHGVHIGIVVASTLWKKCPDFEPPTRSQRLVHHVR